MKRFCLIFSVLFTSVAVYSADRWQTPCIGPEEQEVIKKAERITVTAHDGNRYHKQFNVFFDVNRERIKKVIQEHIDTLSEKPTKDYDHSYAQAILSRQHLYENLKKALSKGKRPDFGCGCSDYDTSSICHMPALQAELLVNICLQVAAETNEKPTATQKIDLQKMLKFREVLAKQVQADLQNKKNWEYTPSNNTGIDYSQHYRIEIRDWLKKNTAQAPFVPEVSTTGDKYIPRDLTSDIEAGKDWIDDVLPSRQLWSDVVRVYGENQHKDTKQKTLCFIDYDWGYNVLLELPNIDKNENDFSITAYEWATNKENNRCCFAYRHPCFSTLQNKMDNSFGIAYVDLPSWEKREYGIEFMPEHGDEIDNAQSDIRKLLRKKIYRQILPKNKLIRVNEEVTAIAYDDASRCILYAHENQLKMVQNWAGRQQLFNLHTFEADIKKIFVTAKGVWFVFVPGNGVDRNSKLYRIPDRTPLYVTEVLHLRGMIDIAFDKTTKNFVMLTKDGVTRCPSGSENMHPDIGRNIGHPSFDYATYKYNAIDYQNGQIYVMHKPYVETGIEPEDGYVLIYPPVFAATQLLLASPLDATTASSSSASSSANSVPKQDSDSDVSSGEDSDKEEAEGEGSVLPGANLSPVQKAALQAVVEAEDEDSDNYIRALNTRTAEDFKQS